MPLETPLETEVILRNFMKTEHVDLGEAVWMLNCLAENFYGNAYEHALIKACVQRVEGAVEELKKLQRPTPAKKRE